MRLGEHMPATLPCPRCCSNRRAGRRQLQARRMQVCTPAHVCVSQVAHGVCINDAGAAACAGATGKTVGESQRALWRKSQYRNLGKEEGDAVAPHTTPERTPPPGHCHHPHPPATMVQMRPLGFRMDSLREEPVASSRECTASSWGGGGGGDGHVLRVWWQRWQRNNTSFELEGSARGLPRLRCPLLRSLDVGGGLPWGMRRGGRGREQLQRKPGAQSPRSTAVSPHLHPACVALHCLHLRRHGAAEGQRELHVAPLLGAAGQQKQHSGIRQGDEHVARRNNGALVCARRQRRCLHHGAASLRTASAAGRPASTPPNQQGLPQGVRPR